VGCDDNLHAALLGNRKKAGHQLSLPLWIERKLRLINNENPGLILESNNIAKQQNNLLLSRGKFGRGKLCSTIVVSDYESFRAKVELSGLAFQERIEGINESRNGSKSRLEGINAPF